MLGRAAKEMNEQAERELTEHERYRDRRFVEQWQKRHDQAIKNVGKWLGVRVEVDLDMSTWNLEAPDAEGTPEGGDVFASVLQQLEEVVAAGINNEDVEGLAEILDARVEHLRRLLAQVNTIFYDGHEQRVVQSDIRKACREEISRANIDRWGEVVNLTWLQEKCGLEMRRLLRENHLTWLEEKCSMEQRRSPSLQAYRTDMYGVHSLTWVERQPLW